MHFQDPLNRASCLKDLDQRSEEIFSCLAEELQLGPNNEIMAETEASKWERSLVLGPQQINAFDCGPIPAFNMYLRLFFGVAAFPIFHSLLTAATSMVPFSAKWGYVKDLGCYALDGAYS